MIESFLIISDHSSHLNSLDLLGKCDPALDPVLDGNDGGKVGQIIEERLDKTTPLSALRCIGRMTRRFCTW